MCQKLDITIIGAASPQTKGRIERNHGTQQDRLIKKMRLHALSDDAAANAYLTATYLPQHNERFAVLPASGVDHHRPRDRRLRDDDIFCLEETRVVGQDYVIQYKAHGLQLDRAARGRVPAKSVVLVRETEDGRIRVIHVRATGASVCVPGRLRSREPRPHVPPCDTSPRRHPPHRRSRPIGRRPTIHGARNTLAGSNKPCSATPRCPPPRSRVHYPLSHSTPPRDISIRPAEGKFLSALDSWMSNCLTDASGCDRLQTYDEPFRARQ